MFVQGHASNSITRIPESLKGLKALELIVVADPHPTTWASLAVQAGRKEDMYLLPVASQFECKGSRVASNRSMQWGEQIVKPIFESKDDLEVIYRIAKKCGFADRMFKNIKVENNLPVAEDVLREMNRGSWSTGYCGQSPERIKSHMANQADFDMLTQRATTGPNKGDYYGLPWPCWGSPEVRHPGTPLLYNTNLSAMDGGGVFRARFGVEREEKRPDGTTVKVSLLADGSASKDSEIKDGYPEFTVGVLKKLGWDKDLTEAELAVINKVNPANPDAVSWSTDLSGGVQRVVLKHGCIPYGNAKARMNAFGLPDPIPVHREPIYTPRVDLVEKYPSLPDARQFRLPNIGFSIQKAAVEKGIAKQFPLILSSGRLVEYEGGGEETRSNKWLAELQQDMFIEINPADAAERGIKDGGWVWVTGTENSSKAKMKALVTERVGKGVAWMPFHFGGWFGGEDLRANYPAGADPVVLGESANTITSYGYDPATGMQEAKVTLCQIRAA
jgi:formate dehydrogenase major subunit